MQLFTRKCIIGRKFILIATVCAQIVCNEGVIRINRWNLVVLLLMIQRVFYFLYFSNSVL